LSNGQREQDGVSCSTETTTTSEPDSKEIPATRVKGLSALEIRWYRGYVRP